MESLMGSKLAETVSKLTSGNKLVQCQAIEKINNYLIEFKSSEPQIKKLLSHLFENIHLILSRTCCAALLSMLCENCKANIIDLNYLITSLLNLINSKKENSVYCLYALTDLMLHFQEYFIGKYSIRNPSHPFIEILRNSNEKKDNLHDLIFQQIKIIYESEKIPFETSTTILKPVLVYIFLDQSNYKHLVAQYLITLLHKNFLAKDLIMVYFSFLKPNELANFQTFESVRSLVQVFVENPNADLISKDSILNLLLKFDRLNSFNLSSEWIKIKHCIENSKSQLDNKEFLISLAANLSLVSVNNLNAYLQLVSTCIDKANKNLNFYLALFVPNILEYILAFSALEYDSKFKELKLKFTQILTQIEKRIYDKKTSYDLDTSSIFNLVSYETKEPLVRDPNETCDRENLNFLCAYFILNETDLDVTIKITELFKKLCVRLPYLNVLFFCLYIYKLKMTSNEKIVYHLLTTFIDLIVPRIDVNLFINIINYLTDSTSHDDNLSVKLICLKQLTRLCTMKLDYIVYPRLSKELVTLDSRLSTNKNRIKILYAKALCIYDLILYRPDYYAQELLATISSLLNMCSHAEDAGVCAILIDSMAYLCHTLVVDIESTFNALYPQFKNEKRLLVLNAYCRFMSEIASRRDLYSPEDTNNFYIRMIKQLWSLFKLDDKNSCSNWVLIALSKFNRNDFKCSYLPAQIQEGLKNRNKRLLSLEQNKEKTLDELFETVPASCYFDIFNLIDSSCYEGLRKFLEKYLTEEIDSIPRHSLYNAREKELTVDDQARKQKAFYELISDFLADEFNTAKATQSIDINYLLYCYEAPIELNSYGKPIKRNLLTNWTSYENNFNLLITKCQIDLKTNRLEDIKNGLDRFISKAYESCINAHEFNLKQTFDASQRVEEDEKHLSIIARNKLLQIIINGSNLALDQNLVVLAFASLIESSSQFMQINLAKDESILKEHSKWLETIVDFILNITENKISTKNEFLNSFSYKEVFNKTELEFMYELFKKTPEITKYFLSKIQPMCVKFQVKTYLNQYLERIQLDFFNINESNDKLALEAFSLYVENYIKSRKQFTDLDNKHINEQIRKIYNKYLLLENSDMIQSYLIVLTQCLNCLYDEESVFYDEDQILEKILSKLYASFEAKNLERNLVQSYVNLNCIAYKSNLISNENMYQIYEFLSTNSKLNHLNAFFCRFLFLFGYSDAQQWIESLYKKWAKYINDFKLNITTDVIELKNSLQGLLAAISGVTAGCLCFKQMNYFTEETDKLLRPEQTLKEIIKLFKAKDASDVLDGIKPVIKYQLSLMHLNHNDQKYETLYSMPSNYDYLDESSILRSTVSELIQIAKTSNSTNEKKFEFLVELLLDSCKHSQTQTLPPLNWYYFTSSLLKSKLGKLVETNLISLLLLQLKVSNSAFALLKNFLIDTNYFHNLKFETQLLILNSLNSIWSKLNKILLEKFLNKIKLFLRQNWSKETEDTRIIDIFKAVLNSLIQYSKTNRENYCQILDFYNFIYSDFSFNITNSLQREIVDLLATSLISFNDDEALIDYLNALELVPQINQKLLMIFYIKCKLVSLHYKPLSFLTDSISNAILLINDADESLETNFVNVFSECMIMSRNKAYLDLQKSQKSSLVNVAFNWLIEFIELVKSLNSKEPLSSKMIDFVIDLLNSYMYAWCNQWTTETISEFQSIDYNLKLNKENLKSYLRKLLKIPQWKQLQMKMIDWFLVLFNFKNISPKTKSNIQSILVELFLIQEDLNPDVWFKFAELVYNN